MYIAILHSLYSSFIWGCWVIVGCCNGSLYKRGWKPCIIRI